jgi:hypothetical protein
MGGICLIKDHSQVLGTVRPDQTRRLPISLPPCFDALPIQIAVFIRD